jgi:hypothetical protein
MRNISHVNRSNCITILTLADSKFTLLASDWFRNYHSVQKLLSSRLLSKNLKIRIYKTIILSVVLYGCETWFLTLREKHRLRVFENRVLRKIFGPKGDEVIGGWINLHNEELHNLYCSPKIIRIKLRRMRWTGHVARMGRSGMHIGFWW